MSNGYTVQIVLDGKVMSEIRAANRSDAAQKAWFRRQDEGLEVVNVKLPHGQVVEVKREWSSATVVEGELLRADEEG